MSDNEEEQSSQEEQSTQEEQINEIDSKDEPKETFPDYPRPPEYDSWIPAKKSAWDQLHVNPSAFFYRHRLPGEEKKNGPWSEEEKMFFIQKLREKPHLTKDWGGFARGIPGRVGYQCNSFFKKLVATGEIQRLAPDIVIPENVIANINNKKVFKPKETVLSCAKLENDDQKEVIIPKIEIKPVKELPSDAKESILKNADLFF